MTLTTVRDIARRALGASRTYWAAPDFLGPQPAVADLVAYAHLGAWTASAGAVRRAGVVWCRLVALPATTVCRALAWAAQRPGRAVAVWVVWRVGVGTDAGGWIAANVIVPVCRALAWAAGI